MSGNKIYVGNLSFTASEEDLKEVLTQYGNIAQSIVVRDRDTGKSKGFAFVSFEDSESAERAVSGMVGKQVCGRPVRVSIAEDRSRKNASRGGGYDQKGSGYRDNRY